MSTPESSLCTTFTDLPPCCVLFTPEDPNLIVVGTYLLNESIADHGVAERKTGSLCLYLKSPSSASSSSGDVKGYQLKPIARTPATHAILDLKFSPHNPTLLAAAQSFGTLSLFNIITSSSSSSSSPKINPGPTFALSEPSLLVLSIAFSPTVPGHVAYTLSNGRIGIFSISSPEEEGGGGGGGGSSVWEHKAHSEEAWTVEFLRDGKGLYSGGDDLLFNKFDFGTGAGVLEWKDGKTHGAGVTAVLGGGEGGVVLTGCYDEFLRAFDERCGVGGAGGRRKVVDDVRVVGGGVWRIHRRDERSVLASCMHAGARVISVGEGGRPLSIVARFEEHESMNYGSHIHDSDLRTVVSCSFYDKRVCIWSI